MTASRLMHGIYIYAHTHFDDFELDFDFETFVRLAQLV